MALTPADITGIEAALSGAGAVAEAYAALRARFPKLSLTRADELTWAWKRRSGNMRFSICTWSMAATIAGR